jgi:UbiD family decarboxylase
MTFSNFREFLGKLEEENELCRIAEEVSPEPDVGSIGRAICDMPGGGPGVICENVAGYEVPLVFCVHASNRSIALSFDLPKDIPMKELLYEIASRWDDYPVEPKKVRKAVCKEVVKVGDQVNLLEFPIVRWNTEDGAPFITKPAIINKDPESGIYNIGMYRMQIKGLQTAGMGFSPNHDMGIHLKWAEENSEPLEVAIALGNEPAISFAACCPIPIDWDEFQFAGALKGSPIEIVKAETVDLYVPANSEIIIEGNIKLNHREIEGPYGEYSGHYSILRRYPEMEITAITHRKNPMYEGLFVSHPPNELDYFTHLLYSATVYRQAKGIIPELVAYNNASNWGLTGIASVKQKYAGLARKLMMAIWAIPHGGFIKNLLIVDDDIDVFNLSQVFWALSTRFQADRDIVIVRDAPGGQIDPSAMIKGLTTKAGFDLTWPVPPAVQPKYLGVIKARAETEVWKEKIKDYLRS